MSKYSDQTKAEALTLLDANDGNITRTAEQLEMPLVTLWEWARGRVHPDVQKMREGMTQQLGDRMELLAVTCLDRLPSKLETATAAQLATISGIAIDKMQVLRGKPDTITQSASQLDPDQAAEKINQLLQNARRRRLEAEALQEDAETQH